MQFSRTLYALPVLAALASPAAAQTRYRVLTDGEWFHQEANGRRLARLTRGALVTGAPAQGDWIRVTLDGWIWAPSVGPTPRAGFDLAVTQAPEENLRAAPSGTIVARLAEGFLLIKLGEEGRWVHVRRDGWVQRTGLEAVAQVASETASLPADSAAAPPAARPADGGQVDPARSQAARQTTVYRAPEGPAAGTIRPETPLRVVSKSGEWTRVQIDGWVKTEDLRDAPPGVLLGVSAAEVRADPSRYEGQSLRWTLQFIALRTADELRPDMPRGATYMLARGPLPERGFVYVVVPDGRRDVVQTLTPLATIRVTGRVRAGRSRFLGNPVVDLLALEVLE